MEYTNKNKREEGDEKYTLGEWCLREGISKGKSIEIPSLNLRLNPDGSVTFLDKKVL